MNKNYPAKSNSANREQTTEDIYRELNIRYRICVKFVPKNEEEPSICKCNRPENVHPPGSKDTSWDMFNNTLEELNPAHGKLVNGAKYTQLALDTPETKVEKILYQYWKLSPPRLIMSIGGGAKYFQLSERLETNFINGIINVALKSDAWVFTNGYNVGIVQLVGQAINKVKLTNPKKSITAIALCKWGSVKDVEKITNPRNNTKQKMNNKPDDGKLKKREHGQRDLEMNHSHYLMLDDGTVRSYDIGDYRTRLCAQLAKLQHESDFPIPVVSIVVEGGKGTIKNMYHDLRANIPVVIIDGSGRVADFFKRWLLYTKEFDNQSEDSEIAYDIDELDKVVTPVITLPLINPSGDEGSNSKSRNLTYVQIQLDKSKQALEEKFRKYAVQLEKDLLSMIAHDDDDEKKSSKNKSSPNKKKSSKKNEKDNTLCQVMYCLQPAVRSGISVFDLNSNDDLSETIFRSICKSRQKYFERKENDQIEAAEKIQRKHKSPSSLQVKQRQNVNKQDQNAQRSQLLQLAMDWDCIDVAKELILQNSLDNILNKEQAFLYALTHDLPTFIYEFLKLGADPSEIFFPDEDFFVSTNRYTKFIQCLYYKDTVNSAATHLSSFIQSDDDLMEKHIHSTHDLNSILSVLVGDYMHQIYFNSAHDERKYHSLWGLKDQCQGDGEDEHLNSEHRQLSEDYIMRDLFLWSILINRIDMSKVFLAHMKYCICAALIATKILKEYHLKASHGALKDSYMESIDYFQNYAIECVNQCEQNDANQACQIVLQGIELYGNVTCLQVAADANDKLFIATSCCVHAMHNTWYDKIHPEQSRERNKAALAIGFFTFGLLAPFLVAFRKGITGLKDEPLNRSLQSYGINYSDPYPIGYPRYSKILPINQYLHRLKNFHQALCMKYCYHWITYCFFLLLFSYTLLFNFEPPTNDIPSIYWTEILTIILVSCMLIEEIHYFFSLDNLTLWGKTSSYFRNLFKFMTLTGFVLFYIGLILRFTNANTEDQFVAARIVMAFDVEIWWLRSLTFISVIPFLGPHLVAIGKMLKDLLFFMCIIAVVMIGYGVASRSMVYYPNANLFNDTMTDTAFDGRSIFRQIIYPVYYFLYGQFGNELTDLDTYPNAGWAIATQVLPAIHMIFVNILLTNFLIAIFSKRFDQVYDDTKNIWHSQQYLFVREYYTRSPLFPPINLFYDIYHLCRLTFFAIRIRFGKSSDRRAEVFKIIPVNKEVVKEWCAFEGASTYEYAQAAVKASKAASAASTGGSDFSNTENKDDGSDDNKDSNGSASSLRQVQSDLAKLTSSLEEIKVQLTLLNNKIPGT